MNSIPMTERAGGAWKRWVRRRWRRIMAGAILVPIVGVILFNVLSDRLVTRYERTALRDPESIYLKGATPRELGPGDASCAVLFIHGFIGAQSNFNDLPDQVAAEGFYVRTMRLPGHGTTPREFENTNADDLLAGVLAEVRGLKSRFSRVIVVGHSMGGALATLAAAEESVDGLVLCAPFFDLTQRRILGISTEGLVNALSSVIRWAPGRPGGGPVNLKENRKHIDCYQWIPSQGGLTALEVGRRARDPELCRSISAPLLVLHSKLDRVTSQEATERQVPHFGSAIKRTIWLETSDHVIFWDYEQRVVSKAVLAFIKEVEAS